MGNDGKDALTDEQRRLWSQVEIIKRDVEMRPFGQPYRRSDDGVDKATGKTIAYRDLEKCAGDVLRDEKGRVISPEEYMAMQEGWGRPNGQPATKDGAWVLNANVGIRTRGEDALNIVLVETKGKPFRQEERDGEKLRVGEMRRWEYVISRKGQDAGDSGNVIHVPVFSTFGGGLFADIGNKGSQYTSRSLTTKNFQPQRILRHADDIDIVIPPPDGMGVATAILNRDPFEAFAGKKAIRGGRVIIPLDSMDIVSRGFSSSVLQLKGHGDAWGQIIYPNGVSLAKAEEHRKDFEGTLYAANPMPQDELTFVEGTKQKKIDHLSVPAIDGEGAVSEGASVVMSGNTGTGAHLRVNGKDVKVPPQGWLAGEPKQAWAATPVWLHGPGNKGSVDVSGLDGRVVISGGGHILTSQKTANTWWYADVILAGGTPQEKAVYTIEIPQFDDPKLKLDIRQDEKNRRRLHIERYPMPPYQTIPLIYPDGESVPVGRTENDHISIKGDHIEVRIKEGDKERVIFDSDKPTPEQHGMSRRSSLPAVGIAMAAAASDTTQDRRRFLAGSAVTGIGFLLGRQGAALPGLEGHTLSVAPSVLQAPDPVTASIETLMPDVVLHANGRSTVRTSMMSHGGGKGAAIG